MPFLASPPAGGKKVNSMVAGINMAVFKHTKNKDGALSFVKFMTSDEEQTLLNKTYGSLPAVKTAASDPAFAARSRRPSRRPWSPPRPAAAGARGEHLRDPGRHRDEGAVRRRGQRQAGHRAVGEGEADRRAAEDALTRRHRWPWSGAEPDHGHRLREDPDGNQHHRAGRRPTRIPGRVTGPAACRPAAHAAHSCRTCCSDRPSCWNSPST
ncbi:extracellular solute-binding protein [Micromonospora sp. M12]